MLKALRKKTARSSSDIVGFIERITSEEIVGWAASRTGSLLNLSLLVNGQDLNADVVWIERQDVFESLGIDKKDVGFAIRLTSGTRNQIEKSWGHKKSLKVLANGVPLPWAKNLSLELETEKHQAPIEGMSLFMISGWAATNGAPVKSLELLCNGVPVNCAVIRKERRDVAEVLKSQHLETGFEIELPGHIWENVPLSGGCKLELRAGGIVLTQQPITLDRAKAADWITTITRMSEGPEKQYRALLALEHVRYSKILPGLDDEAKRFVQEFARQMQLEDFVFAEAAEQGQPEDASIEDVSTLLLWKALQRLNARLIDAPEGAFTQVKAVHDELLLTGETKQRYLMSVIPLLCRHNEFLRLRSLMDFSSLYHLEYGSSVWEMSLALAPLVADQHIGRVHGLFWRLAKQLDTGWLNTECIRFAVEHIQKLGSQGEIELLTAERFRYAFIGLLDSFKGEWFSRLHDCELIDAMVSLLADLERYTDYHKRDVVAGAIRHYGLCPTFWQHLACRLPTLRDNELSRAKAAWERLHITLNQRELPLSEHLEELHEPILYFQRRGNPEALNFLREIVANSLPELNRALSPTGKVLIETLLASDPSEALRLAAFPLEDENALQVQFPETRNHLLHTLRQLTECDKSVVYDLQCTAATALKTAQVAANNKDHAGLKAALAEVEKKATALANWQGMFLGADLIASAYILAANAGLETVAFLLRLGMIVRSAVNESKAEFYLPSPVCSALARLAALPGDAVLRGFLRETQTAIRSKFGGLHDELFSALTTPILAVENGWPQDTLVVIYSCRKYLDTRVQAIRETWVQDLKARSIPYVVLVGDGDDTLKGDVLALNVSDRYEDLPKKTLKLFDWVYRNTDAQYVLKIDDDCYLDVGRYFDTLSYRKHYYYGRVIRRGVGSMDRAWHQSKSHTAHGKKAIDKSPEPSVYADGGGGYCLSRLAILALLRAEKTEAGKRLLACSFMEDKLVGDLLALGHILPSNEDYESYQRRRTFGEAMPVAMWENTFFPSRFTPTKVVHLDTEQHLATTRERAASEALWPKKLWSTCWKPSILLNSNQLELLTQTDSAKELLLQNLVAVSVVRNETTMLPHFLSHYRALGVKCFIFVDNCSDDGTREYLFKQPDVVLFSSDTEYKHSHYGVAWQQAILGNLCLGKWVLLADADELLVFPDCEIRSLAEFIAEIEAEGADAVRVDMIDMYPFGDLSEADFNKQTPFDTAGWFDRPAIEPWLLGSGWFSNSNGFVSHLRHRAVPNAVPHDFVSQKYALLRYQPWVRVSQGVHYAANLKVSAHTAWFAHFKYHAGFKEKILTEIRRGQHFNNAAEYRRYAAMLAEGKGCFGEEGMSQRYEDSGSFVNLTEAIS